jgi:site-specific DNA-methyltransferase (adenine-specific)
MTTKTPAIQKLTPHPLADLLPMMSESEFQALKADIAANGLREPVILLDGKILDGRNRHRACCELGQITPTVDFNPKWGSPVSYVYSKAVHRNMNDSQKAAAAVHFEREFAKHGQARMKAGGKEPVPEGAKGQSRDQAGALFGVSGRYVQDAKALFERDQKLFQQVFEGQLPITRAKRLMIRAARVQEVTKKIAAGHASVKMSGHQIITGDAIAQLGKLDRHSARLTFADPPYNLGFKYDADPTGDKLDPDLYVKWCLEWIKEAHRVLTPDGSLLLLHCEEYQHLMGCVLNQAGFTIRRLIVWYETFGENCTRNFNRTCRYLYYAVKDPKRFVFNEDAFLVESARAAVYGDKRAMPGGKILDALWQISRLQGTSAERVVDADAPTQLPLALMTRIVNGFTDPGDLVVDPFTGTGSTGHACILSSRRFLGIERSAKYAASARQRLIMAAAEQGERKAS